jgi:hypothetical protein
MPISEPIPILSKKKTNRMPYDLWIEDNKEELIFVYKLIKNYDKDMDFLNNCEFSIFCSFCYQKSSGIKQKYF